MNVMGELFCSLLESREEKIGLTTKTYNRHDLTLKYPDNVIVVGYPGKTPLPTFGELRKATLDEAITYAENEASNGRGKAFSILVHKYSYVDDINDIPSKKMPTGFALEIIGLGGVRIQCSRFGPVIKGVKVTFKNIVFMDMRKLKGLNLSCFTVDATQGAKVELIDVKMHAGDVFCVGAYNHGSIVTLTNCDLVQSRGAVSAQDGGNIVMVDCRVSNMGTRCVDVTSNSSFTAKASTFTNCRQVSIQASSKALFVDCQIKGPFDINNPGTITDEDDGSVLMASAQSSISVKGTTFDGWMNVANATEFAVMAFDNCCIKNCISLAVAGLNSKITCENSELGCFFAIKLVYNMKGKAIFKNNTVPDGKTISLFKDRNSAEPIHDFKDFKLTNEEEDLQRELGNLPGRKERSKYTKMKKTEAGGQFVDNPYYKACGRCGYPEGGPSAINKKSQEDTGKAAAKEEDWPVFERFAVFKYCQGCKKLCYCSKKCQREDWKSHKTVCAWMAGEPIEKPAETDAKKPAKKAAKKKTESCPWEEIGSGVNRSHEFITNFILYLK